MGRYSRTPEQRAALDGIVLEAIRDGWSTPDVLREVVRDRLIRTGETWAKVLARATDFPITLRSVMARLRDAQKIVAELHGAAPKWKVVP